MTLPKTFSLRWLPLCREAVDGVKGFDEIQGKLATLPETAPGRCETNGFWRDDLPSTLPVIGVGRLVSIKNW